MATNTFPPDKLAEYRAFWKRRNQVQLTPEMRAAAEAARAEAKRLAQILADEFGVKRVYLFGSFAWGFETRPDSDIDLAVEGLPPEKFFKAYGRLENTTRYAFDLVPLEQARSRLRERILKSGIVLYDSSPQPSAG